MGARILIVEDDADINDASHFNVVYTGKLIFGMKAKIYSGTA